MTTSTTPTDPTMLQGRRPGTGLIYLVTAGLLWGTGGLTGTLLSRSAGLPALSVAAYRLGVGGTLILAFLVLTGRRRASRRPSSSSTTHRACRSFSWHCPARVFPSSSWVILD